MKCRNCGEELPANSTVRRAFCNDVCRVQHNRATKANDLYFDAVVAVRRLAKSGKIEDLRLLQDEIKDLIKNNS